MKVPPKRKGNYRRGGVLSGTAPLNESPSEKEGKFRQSAAGRVPTRTLNESPSEKEGKSEGHECQPQRVETLNESPSEKEGKYLLDVWDGFPAVGPQ